MVEISVELVSALVAEQFPQWAELPVRPVPKQGWDNRTFRLGDELSVRLPSGDGYSSGIVKEDQVLPMLSGRLPIAIPEVVASGQPSARFPRPFTVRRWLAGQTPDQPGQPIRSGSTATWPWATCCWSTADSVP